MELGFIDCRKEKQFEENLRKTISFAWFQSNIRLKLKIPPLLMWINQMNRHAFSSALNFDLLIKIHDDQLLSKKSVIKNFVDLDVYNMHVLLFANLQKAKSVVFAPRKPQKVCQQVNCEYRNKDIDRMPSVTPAVHGKEKNVRRQWNKRQNWPNQFSALSNDDWFCGRTNSELPPLNLSLQRCYMLKKQID